jgi:hypothetical protein
MPEQAGDEQEAEDESSGRRESEKTGDEQSGDSPGAFHSVRLLRVSFQYWMTFRYDAYPTPRGQSARRFCKGPAATP